MQQLILVLMVIIDAEDVGMQMWLISTAKVDNSDKCLYISSIYNDLENKHFSICSPIGDEWISVYFVPFVWALSINIDIKPS